MDSKVKNMVLFGVVMVIFIGACVLSFLPKDKNKNNDSNQNQQVQVSENQAGDEVVSSASDSNIVLEENLVVDSSLDPTHVTSSVTGIDNWATTLGISMSESENSANNTGYYELEVNDTMGSSTGSIFEEAANENAFYTIDQIDSNIPDTIKINSFNINNGEILSLPINASKLGLYTDKKDNDLELASPDYYFKGHGYCIADYQYAANKCVLYTSVNKKTNMINAICYNYPHYVDDESYFTCYLAGVTIGNTRNDVEEYFGEGYSIDPTTVCYKNATGTLIIQYEINVTKDEDGNEVASTAKNMNAKVEKIILYAAK